MSEVFDPDKALGNYKSKLKEHYKTINKRLGVPKVPRKGVSRLEQDLFNIVDAKPEPKHIKEITEENNKIIMPEELREAIKSGLLKPKDAEGNTLSIKDVLKIICEAYRLTYNDVIGPSKSPNLVRMRANIVQTLFVMYGDKINVSQVAKLLMRDHSTLFNMIAIYTIDREAKVKNYSNIRYVPPVIRAKRKKKCIKDSPT